MLWGSTGTPPACLPWMWQVQGGLAPPGQHCSLNLTGTHSSRVLGQTHLFHFYFWPPEKWHGRCPDWGMVNGPIPGGLRVPGCGRAWQAPCHSSGPSSFGKLRWGSLGRGREERKSPCATQPQALYPGSAAAGAKRYAADRRRRQSAGSPCHLWEQSTPDALGGMLVSISSGVSIGKLRHEECLCFPTAPGVQVARAVAGLSTPPGPPSSHQPRAGTLISPACVARAWVGPAMGMAPVPTDSA